MKIKATMQAPCVMLSSSREHRADFKCCSCGFTWSRVAKQIDLESCQKCGGNVIYVEAEPVK